MRKVEYWEYIKVQEKNPTKIYWKRGPKKIGSFHQFGVNYEKLVDGPVNYTTAIIETEDGHVKNLSVDQIVFLDKSDGTT